LAKAVLMPHCPGVPSDMSVDLRMLETSRTLFLPPERITDRPFWAGHVPFAMWLVEQHKPRLIVELGTETGVSLAAFCQAAAALDLVCDIHGVDSWEGDSHTGHYVGVYEDLRAYLFKKGYGFVHLHRMLFDEALALFEDDSVDLLHIDGYHTYDAVRHDFESWRPKLSSRAVVLIHDIHVKKADFGVWRYWQELRQDYRSVDFKHSNGLGVISLDEQPPSWLSSVTAEDSGGTLALRPFARNLFQALGDRPLEVAVAQEALARAEKLAQALAQADNLAQERLAEAHKLDEQLRTTQAALAEADELALVRLESTVQLDAQLRTTQAALARAEELVEQRQQDWASLDAQLRLTQEALVNAERFAFERLRQIEALGAELVELRRQALVTRP
jgi:O-antigen biosynthesis protein